MKKLSLALAILTGVWTLQSCTEGRGNSYATKTKVDINGVTFIKTIHEGGLVEIDASKIAKKNSTNADVTAFADMMITDHTAMGADVDSLAAHKFVIVRDTVDYDHKTILDSLSKKTGAAFDKAYMALMVSGHKDAAELFEIKKTSNYTEIRDVVEKYQSKIEDHLKAAEKVSASLK